MGGTTVGTVRTARPVVAAVALVRPTTTSHEHSPINRRRRQPREQSSCTETAEVLPLARVRRREEVVVVLVGAEAMRRPFDGRATVALESR